MIPDNAIIDLAHTIMSKHYFKDGKKNQIAAMLEFAEDYHKIVTAAAMEQYHSQSLPVEKGESIVVKAKYQRWIDNIEWHLKTNKPTDKMELQKCHQQINDYKEVIVDIDTIVSNSTSPSQLKQPEKGDK